MQKILKTVLCVMCMCTIFCGTMAASCKVVHATSANAGINYAGSRLRATPSLDGTIKELLYTNDTICILYGTNPPGTKYNSPIYYGPGGYSDVWYYVERISTGTRGWMNRDCIDFWD